MPEPLSDIIQAQIEIIIEMLAETNDFIEDEQFRLEVVNRARIALRYVQTSPLSEATLRRFYAHLALWRMGTRPSRR